MIEQMFADVKHAGTVRVLRAARLFQSSSAGSILATRSVEMTGRSAGHISSQRQRGRTCEKLWSFDHRGSTSIGSK